MTAYQATGNSSHHTLAATVVDIVTLDRAYLSVEVVNRHATADLWVVVDRGSTNQQAVTPTVAGDGCWYIGPGGVRVIQDDSPAQAAPTTIVQLISASAVPYSVTGIDPIS